MSSIKTRSFIGLLTTTLSGWTQPLAMEFTQTIPMTGKAHSISVAQLNDDAYPDMVVLTNDDFTKAKVYLGTPQGTFEVATPMVKNESYRVLDHGDLNADGFDDLVISSYWGGGFKIHWGNGDGTFTEGQRYGLTGHGRKVKIHDLNRDGIPDIAALSSGSGQPITLHIYSGGNDQSFTLKGVYTSVLDTDREMTIVDKNGDGLSDIMVSSSFPWFVIFYQQTDGTFVPQYWPFEIELPLPTNYLLADLNGDETPDIIAQYWEGEFRFHEGLQDTLFSPSNTSIPAPTGMWRVQTVDINRDGLIDLVTDKYNEHTDEPSDSIFIFLNTGNFTFSDPQLIRFPGVVEYYIVDDLNNDHFPEIIASCRDIGLVMASNLDVVLTTDPPGPPPLVSYPNPFTDRLIIRTEEPATIMIYSSQGELLQSGQTTDQLDINTSTWTKGIHHVQVITEKGVSWQKVLKQ